MSVFTIEMLEAALNDLVSGRIDLARVRISDTEIAGLRAILSKENQRISYHVSYNVGGTPFQMHIGDAPSTSVEEARKIAVYVIEQGKSGVNVQEESRKRFLDQLRQDADAA